MAKPPSSEHLVVMGRVAAPYAIQGWIKVQPYTDSIDSLLDYDVWRLGRAGQWREYPLITAKVHGQTLLAQLQGVDGRDAAEALQGLEIAVDRAEFPEAKADEYYWDELIGLEVVNAEGANLGKVSGLLETGPHDVLEVQGDRQRLIPFVEAYVREVDRAAGRIVVDWGLDWGLED